MCVRERERERERGRDRERDRELEKERVMLIAENIHTVCMNIANVRLPEFSM